MEFASNPVLKEIFLPSLLHIGGPLFLALALYTTAVAAFLKRYEKKQEQKSWK